MSRTLGILTFHLDVVVWKTKCFQAPAICYGSCPCEVGGEKEKKRRAEIKGKAHTVDCISRLLHSSIWVDMANIITQKLTVLLCLDTAEPRDGSKGEERKNPTVIKVGKGAKSGSD